MTWAEFVFADTEFTKHIFLIISTHNYNYIKTTSTEYFNKTKTIRNWLWLLFDLCNIYATFYKDNKFLVILYNYKTNHLQITKIIHLIIVMNISQQTTHWHGMHQLL